MERLTVTIPEVAKLLGIHKQAAYELAKKPGFPAIRVTERRIIVPVDKLHEWLDKEACGDSGVIR